MRFPEWLYRLLPGDQGSQQLGAIWRELSTTDSAVTVGGGIYTVPNDKCLVLTNATLRAVPGSATTTTRRRVMADPPAGTTRYDIYDEEVDVANNAITSNWQGEVVIPSGWRVRAEVTFTSAVNPNTVTSEIFGYLIPRGSFVFG